MNPNENLDEHDDAPWDHPRLLGQMQTVLWDAHGKKWDARARKSEHFASSPSIGAAMTEAIRLRDAPPRARRILIVEE